MRPLRGRRKRVRHLIMHGNLSGARGVRTRDVGYGRRVQSKPQHCGALVLISRAAPHFFFASFFLKHSRFFKAKIRLHRCDCPKKSTV